MSESGEDATRRGNILPRARSFQTANAESGRPSRSEKLASLATRRLVPSVLLDVWLGSHLASPVSSAPFTAEQSRLMDRFNPSIDSAAAPETVRWPYI